MPTVNAVMHASLARVTITITGLPTAPADVEDPWPATPWTLYRSDGLNESVVRGAIDVGLDSTSTEVVQDREYPLSKPFLYVLRYVDAVDGAVVVYSGWVSAPTPELPRISDPVSGEGVDLTVVEWPSESFESRGTYLDIDGRPDGYTLAGSLRAPESEITLRTDDAAGWRSLRRLLMPGGTVYLRPSTPELDEAYLYVQSYRVDRITNRASDARRLHLLQVRTVSITQPNIAAQGSTLADLHAAFPGDLGDIAAAFTQLYEIAAAPL